MFYASMGKRTTLGGRSVYCVSNYINNIKLNIEFKSQHSNNNLLQKKKRVSISSISTLNSDYIQIRVKNSVF